MPSLNMSSTLFIIGLCLFIAKLAGVLPLSWLLTLLPWIIIGCLEVFAWAASVGGRKP